MSTSPRVIAGRFHGRPLRVPRGLATRPTAARVRKSLFDILGNLEGARVLDLYAGSGALAIEALSHGASFAALVERDRRALECITQNLSLVGATAMTRVLGVPAERAVERLRGGAPFDVVLSDPPWDAVEAALEVVGGLVAAGLLAERGVVTLEHRKDARPLAPPGLAAYDRRTFGDAGITFFRLVSHPDE